MNKKEVSQACRGIPQRESSTGYFSCLPLVLMKSSYAKPGFMSSEGKGKHLEKIRSERSLAGSGVRMAEKAKKLRIAMFGDGDIIGTTKKNHVESGLLAA